MQDAVAVLSTDDDHVPGLLQELAPPALPTDGISSRFHVLARQPIRRGEGEHQPGQQDVHAHRPRGFLGRMRQTPLLLPFFHTAILDETVVIVIIKGLQGLVHRGVGQKDGFPPRALVVCHSGLDT
jgi:hypothetical protein